MKYLIALTLMLVGTSCYADFVIQTIPGTGAFNTSLGTLNKVTVRFRETNVSMGNAAPHSHTIAAGTVGQFTVSGVIGFGGFTLDPLTTTSNGEHTHTFSVPTFSWNGKNISLGTLTSTTGGLHSHTVSGMTFSNSSGSYLLSSNVTTSSEDSHPQSFSFDRNIEFTGSDLDLFISGSPTPGYSLNFSVPGVNHSHQISAGVYSVNGNTGTVELTQAIVLSGSSGIHNINLTSAALETTFEYTPFSAIPEPSSFILFSVVAGAGAVGRRFWRKRKAA